MRWTSAPTLRSMLCLLALATLPLPLAAQISAQPMRLILQTGHAISSPLRDLVPSTDGSQQSVVPSHSVVPQQPGQSANVSAGLAGPNASTAISSSTTVDLNFDGLPNGGFVPDTNLSVGATQVLQVLNNDFGVFDKFTGALVAGPFNYQVLFGGLGPPCSNGGYDAAVVYDKIAGRWLIAAANNSPGPDYYLCVALSKTSDATGQYNLYAFDFGNTFVVNGATVSIQTDFPKLGVWPDAYYASLSFDPEAAACAFPRSAMLAGQAVSQLICFPMPAAEPSQGILLPADLDGSTPPPAGEPDFFLINKENCSGATNENCSFPGVLDLYRFHVDFGTPGNSSFTGPFAVQNVAPFNNCTNGGWVPQPGTTQALNSFCGWLMNRLAYRNLGDHESLVVVHDEQISSSNTQIGTHWYEIRDPNGMPAVFQQGTYAPDATTSRWMGSAAQDRNGNIAIGYSVSDATSTFPGIRYTGRVAGDTLNTLEAETTLVNGVSAETTGQGHWGDFTSMSIDPMDDCTFWYVSEYMKSTPVPFTHIGSFRFNNCNGFTMSAAPAQQPLLAGGTANFVLTLIANGGFSAPVNLSCDNPPQGLNCALSPSSVTPTASGVKVNVTVTTAPTLAQGNYIFEVSATSGSVTHVQTMQIVAGGITGSIAPASATIAAGGSSNFALSLNATGGFSGQVTLACNGAPSGVTCTPNPSAVTLSENGNATSGISVQVSAKPSVSRIFGSPRGAANDLQGAQKAVPVAALVLVLLSFAGFVALRRSEHAALVLARRCAVIALTGALAMAMLSCAGSSSAPSSTSNPGGGSTAVSFPMTVQAQSGSASMNLVPFSVTVP